MRSRGRAAGQPETSQPEPHPAGPGPRNAPHAALPEPRRGPAGDTHRPAVLLQRHQLAPDVHRLEVVEVPLPLRAGHSRQEQPRRHQCSHHDSLQKRRRCESKNEAGDPAWGAEEGDCGAPGGRRQDAPPSSARLWASVSPFAQRGIGPRAPSRTPRPRFQDSEPRDQNLLQGGSPFVPGCRGIGREREVKTCM